MMMMTKPIIPPPPYLLKKFSMDGYLKTFARLCIEWANSKSTPNSSQTRSSDITPPRELVQQWVAEIWHEGTPVQFALSDEHIATRPNPPSLKEQALKQLVDLERVSTGDYSAIRRALEALPE